MGQGQAISSALLHRAVLHHLGQHKQGLDCKLVLRCRKRTRTEKISCRLNNLASSFGSCKGLSNEPFSRHPTVSERRHKSFLLWETIGENQTLCPYCLTCLDEWVIIHSMQTCFSIVMTGHFSQSICFLSVGFPSNTDCTAEMFAPLLLSDT